MKKTVLCVAVLACLLLSGCDSRDDERALLAIAKACDGKLSMKITVGGWSNQVEMYCDDFNLVKKDSER